MFPVSAALRKILRTSVSFLLFVGAAPPFANTITVTSANNDGPGTLRNALANASSGDTINFSFTRQTAIVLSAPLMFGPSVNIVGPSPVENVAQIILSGNHSVVPIIVNREAIVSISGIAIEGNGSAVGGAALNDGTLTLTDCQLTGNDYGTQLGAGILNSGMLTVEHVLFERNGGTSDEEVGFGGAVYNFNGTVTVSDSLFNDNGAISGGAIYNNGGTVTITGSTFVDNGALRGGAALFNFGGSMTISGSAIFRNFCGTLGYDCMGGAALYNHSGTMSITNSTIALNVEATDNSAGGGGVLNNQGALNLSSDTIYANQIYSGAGAGIENLGGMMTVKDSIIASNSQNGNCAATGGTNISVGRNLSDDASCGFLFKQASDLNNKPAGLDPQGLADNGGPILYGQPTMTVKLVAGSPAINAIPITKMDPCADIGGNPVSTDQRGERRPIGCDIGAFESSETLSSTPAATTVR